MPNEIKEEEDTWLSSSSRHSITKMVGGKNQNQILYNIKGRKMPGDRLMCPTASDNNRNSYRPRTQKAMRFYRLVMLLLLAIHILLLAIGGALHSPTLNEPSHLVGGIAAWQFGRFDVDKVTPPLVPMVGATPILFSAAKTDWKNNYEGSGARPEFLLGEDFIAANGERSVWVFTLARWACIPFSVIGGYFCWRWALELYGPKAGLLSLLLWCFCPNILGHGQLLTCDVPAAALGLVACYTFWRWLRHPSVMQTIVCGVTLGISELAKMTLLVLFPAWILLWLTYRWVQPIGLASRFCEFWKIMAQMGIGIFVLNLGYGFEGTFTPLNNYQFVSFALSGHRSTDRSLTIVSNRFANCWEGKLPLPLPKNYLLGIDLQKRDFEDYNRPSYLNGEFKNNGWWYFYLYALTIKVPLGTWILVAMAATRRFCATSSFQNAKSAGGKLDVEISSSSTSINVHRDDSAIWSDEIVLLFPMLLILAFVSSQTGFSEHMRYVLPVFPFVFVWIGRIATCFDRNNWLFTIIATTAIIWSIVSSLSIYPHSLSYFNELVGGPTGGPKHLIQSNVDWGQDLLFLKKWIDGHPEAQPIKLAYFGAIDPKYIGIRYSAPVNIPTGDDIKLGGKKIAPGWYAISVNFVYGLPYFSYKGDGTKINLKQNALAAFQYVKPIAIAGDSIYIYHIEK